MCVRFARRLYGTFDGSGESRNSYRPQPELARMATEPAAILRALRGA